MTFANKQRWVVVFLGICFIAIFQGNNYALMKGNDSEIAFVTPIPEGLMSQPISNGSLLKEYIIEGGGAFLDSYSQTLAFMKQLEVGELHGFDFTGMRQSIDGAIREMEAAENFYVNLKNIADTTSYNPVVISALRRFPYNYYRNELGLNKSIFMSVQNYLQLGDVRGAYGQMLKDTISILDGLYRVKYAIDYGKVPDGQPVWQLNQSYAESLLFGQYMAGVFSEIQKIL